MPPIIVTKTVGPGKDYPSLSAWQSDRKRNLVTANEIEYVECYAMNDTTTAQILGWTTSETNYIKIYTPFSERHHGIWDTSKYYMTNQYGYNITCSQSSLYIHFDGLQFSLQNNNDGACISSGSSPGNVVKISNCIFRGNPLSSSSLRGIYLSNSDTAKNYVWNCIFYNFSKGEAVFIPDHTEIYNCTINSCRWGITFGVNKGIAKNCIVQDVTENGYGFSFDVGDQTNHGDYNISSDGSARGSHSKPNTIIGFRRVDNADFRLIANSEAREAGETNPSGGLFNDDITGKIRSGSWDIGAFENAYYDGAIPVYRQDML